MKIFVGVLLTVSLLACGDGQSGTSDAPVEASLADVPGNQPTIAASLSPPNPTEAPSFTVPPPAAPTDQILRATERTLVPLPLNAGKLAAPSVGRQMFKTGLRAPTDMTFAGEVLLYTERAHGLFSQRSGEPANVLFASKDSAPGGVLSVAVDTNFLGNSFVYVLLGSSAQGIQTIRVVRLKLDASLSKAIESRDILVYSPTTAQPFGKEAAPVADGRLRFGPDGYLYVALSDERSPVASQAASALAGKIFRVTRDGQAAPGNLAPTGFDGRVFAYGMRNPVALAFHPSTEALLVAQRRDAEPDDILRVVPGFNGGRDPRCAPPKAGYCERLEDQLNATKGSSAIPVWRAKKGGEGLAAMEPLREPIWGDWRNAFVLAFDGGQRLELVKFDNDGKASQTLGVLQNLGTRFGALAQGPDGMYVMTKGKPGGDEIWRLFVR